MNMSILLDADLGWQFDLVSLWCMRWADGGYPCTCMYLCTVMISTPGVMKSCPFRVERHSADLGNLTLAV